MVYSTEEEIDVLGATFHLFYRNKNRIFFLEPRNVIFIIEEYFTMSKKAECPECAADVTLPDDVMEGEIVQCAECGVELEVISLDPPELDLAPEEEEDWGE